MDTCILPSPSLVAKAIPTWFPAANFFMVQGLVLCPVPGMSVCCLPRQGPLCVRGDWVPHSRFCVAPRSCSELEMNLFVWALGHWLALVPCLPALPQYTAPMESGVLCGPALSVLWPMVRHSCLPLDPGRRHLEILPPTAPSWGWARARTRLSVLLLAAFQMPIWALSVWKTWKCQGIIFASKKMAADVKTDLVMMM